MDIRERIRQALRRLNPIGERKEGMSVGASVISRPKVSHSEVRRNQWLVEKYSPVLLAELATEVGEEAARRVRTLKRNGKEYVPVSEIGKHFGRALVQVFRPVPDWVAEIPHNNVFHEGLDHSLNSHLKGSAYTAAFYIGLVGTCNAASFADGDTIASHAGWTEITAYDEENRQTLTLGAVSGQSVDNSASKGTFTMSAGTDVGGAFLIYSQGAGTGPGQTGVGTLYGGGPFTGGVRTLAAADTLNVQITCTAGTS